MTKITETDLTQRYRDQFIVPDPYKGPRGFEMWRDLAGLPASFPTLPPVGENDLWGYPGSRLYLSEEHDEAITALRDAIYSRDPDSDAYVPERDIECRIAPGRGITTIARTVEHRMKQDMNYTRVIPLRVNMEPTRESDSAVYTRNPVRRQIRVAIDKALIEGKLQKHIEGQPHDFLQSPNFQRLSAEGLLAELARLGIRATMLVDFSLGASGQAYDYVHVARAIQLQDVLREELGDTQKIVGAVYFGPKHVLDALWGEKEGERRFVDFPSYVQVEIFAILTKHYPKIREVIDSRFLSHAASGTKTLREITQALEADIRRTLGVHGGTVHRLEPQHLVREPSETRSSQKLPPVYPPGVSLQGINIGELARLRRHAGLTQKALGERLGGSSQTSISEWERGHPIPAKRLGQWIQESGADIDQVIFDPGLKERVKGYIAEIQIMQE